MENKKRLIYADALKSRLMNLEASGGHKYYRKGMDDTLHFHMPHIIDEAPTVDAVEVVHGRWIYKWDADRDPKKLFVRIVCSECNLHTGQKSNYCPCCGAKMDGGNENGIAKD